MFLVVSLPLLLLLFSWWSRKFNWRVCFCFVFFCSPFHLSTNAQEVGKNTAYKQYKKWIRYFGTQSNVNLLLLPSFSESMGCYFHGTVARLRNIAHERHRLHLTHICIVFSKITKWQRFTFFARLFFFCWVVRCCRCYAGSFFHLFIFSSQLCFYLRFCFVPNMMVYNMVVR